MSIIIMNTGRSSNKKFPKQHIDVVLKKSNKNIRGLKRSIPHVFTSPCLHAVPIPQRSFTTATSRTGLKSKS